MVPAGARGASQRHECSRTSTALILTLLCQRRDSWRHPRQHRDHDRFGLRPMRAGLRGL